MSDHDSGRPAVAHRLLLLRHGEVASHRGDVPVTPAGLRTATEVGRRLGASASGRLLLLSGETRRTRETAQAIADGATAVGAAVDGPRVAFALRNPDLYLAGARVDMVSSPEDFANQVPRLDPEQVTASTFFSGFLEASDRVGWWLRHPDPPGDDGAAVRARIADFAGSLVDAGPSSGATTIGVTHSPVLRACALGVLDSDPGEPDWVGGLEVRVLTDRSVEMHWLDGAP